MATSTARHPFPLSTSFQSPPTPPRPPQILPIKPLPRRPPILIRSLDVSKEDQQEQQPPILSEEEEPKLDKRRLEEKFAVVNTGVYACRSCGFRFDETVGDPSYPIPPGLPFDRLPDDWRCPTCGASKNFFESKRVEIAGFEQNQQFGFGGNSLTSGQKALLIYGGLLVGFVFFLSGYFLQ